ncbi:bile acid:sodium symporter family protein [Pseudomonas paralcaligenes]|uniref:bile acid:sodium symporter family protein n=1 Tax=Pseudomonas paralcaligenes TaxID=2772558 RepID=UPI001C8269FF|nr:hypothetical protein [Pseudomonas paralcaligenes]
MEQSVLIEIGLPIALAIIMTGMGMTLVPSDFQRVVARPKALIWGALAALLLLPALSIVLAMALRLPAEMAVGLVIIAACPIGTTSNLIAFLARGRLALSIALTVVGSLATIVPCRCSPTSPWSASSTPTPASTCRCCAPSPCCWASYWCRC